MDGEAAALWFFSASKAELTYRLYIQLGEVSVILSLPLFMITSAQAVPSRGTVKAMLFV